MALGNDGTVYVSDGYCNARVQQFSPEGAYQGTFELPQGRTINNPHSIVIGDCPRLLYVADREGQEVHSFDLDSREYRGTLPARHLCSLFVPHNCSPSFSLFLSMSLFG